MARSTTSTCGPGSTRSRSGSPPASATSASRAARRRAVGRPEVHVESEVVQAVAFWAERVLELDRFQPEGPGMTWEEYRERQVSPTRVENGRRAILLIAASTVMLLVAGTIEGFISPIETSSRDSRYLMFWS